MKIWVYRPDKKVPEIDNTLLYYKGRTYTELQESKQEVQQTFPRKYPPHYIEVPNE